MRKFTVRESYLIVTALETQKRETMNEIEEMERQGKNPLFTQGYIAAEHNNAIQFIKENSRKDKYATKEK